VSTETITTYFQTRPRDVLWCAYLQFGAAIPLGLFTAVVVSRLRFLVVRAAGVHIALFGGLMTAFDVALSSLVLWVINLLTPFLRFPVPPVLNSLKAGRYLFKQFPINCCGDSRPPLYRMDVRLGCQFQGVRAMNEVVYSVKRINPRFQLSADAETTLPDGSSFASQVFELSSRGCFIDTAKFIPIGTRVSLRISNGMNDCELPAKVIYTQPGFGIGVHGMGVVFEDMAEDKRRAIESWVHKLSAEKTSN
jgi:PilZ domain